MSTLSRRNHRICSKKRVLKILLNSQEENLCQNLFFNKVAGLKSATLLKTTLAQVFSCEFCEIFKNIFFTEHFWTTACLSKTLLKYLMKKRPINKIWNSLLKKSMSLPMIYHHLQFFISNRFISN